MAKEVRAAVDIALEYPGLYTPVGVKALLRDYTKIRDQGYEKGDTNAIVMLVDLEAALLLAGLTDRQSEIIRQVYVDDKTMDDVAAAIGITRQTVAEDLTEAHRRIAAVYAMWNEETPANIS